MSNRINNLHALNSEIARLEKKVKEKEHQMQQNVAHLKSNIFFRLLNRTLHRKRKEEQENSLFGQLWKNEQVHSALSEIAAMLAGHLWKRKGL